MLEIIEVIRKFFKKVFLATNLLPSSILKVAKMGGSTSINFDTIRQNSTNKKTRELIRLPDQIYYVFILIMIMNGTLN